MTTKRGGEEGRGGEIVGQRVGRRTRGGRVRRRGGKVEGGGMNGREEGGGGCRWVGERWRGSCGCGLGRERDIKERS